MKVVCAIGWVLGIALGIYVCMEWQKGKERVFAERQRLLKDIKAAEETVTATVAASRDDLPALRRRCTIKRSQIKKLKAQKQDLLDKKEAYKQTLAVLSTGTGDMQQQIDVAVEEQKVQAKELGNIREMLGMAEAQVKELKEVVQTVRKGRGR